MDIEEPVEDYEVARNKLKLLGHVVGDEGREDCS